MSVPIQKGVAGEQYAYDPKDDSKRYQIHFKFLDLDENVSVMLRKMDGTQVDLQEGRDYFIDSKGGTGGVWGELRLVTTSDNLPDPADVSYMFVFRSLSNDQAKIFDSQTVFSSTTETALDKLTMLIQDNMDRTLVLRAPIDSQVGPNDLQLPPKSSWQENSLLGIDDNRRLTLFQNDGSFRQLNSDWGETDETKASFIKNKPAIPDTSNFVTATDLNNKKIPEGNKSDKYLGFSSDGKNFSLKDPTDISNCLTSSDMTNREIPSGNRGSKYLGFSPDGSGFSIMSGGDAGTFRFVPPLKLEHSGYAEFFPVGNDFSDKSNRYLIHGRLLLIEDNHRWYLYNTTSSTVEEVDGLNGYDLLPGSDDFPMFFDKNLPSLNVKCFDFNGNLLEYDRTGVYYSGCFSNYKYSIDDDKFSLLKASTSDGKLCGLLFFNPSKGIFHYMDGIDASKNATGVFSCFWQDDSTYSFSAAFKDSDKIKVFVKYWMIGYTQSWQSPQLSFNSVVSIYQVLKDPAALGKHSMYIIYKENNDNLTAFRLRYEAGNTFAVDSFDNIDSSSQEIVLMNSLDVGTINDIFLVTKKDYNKLGFYSTISNSYVKWIELEELLYDSIKYVQKVDDYYFLPLGYSYIAVCKISDNQGNFSPEIERYYYHSICGNIYVSCKRDDKVFHFNVYRNNSKEVFSYKLGYYFTPDLGFFNKETGQIYIIAAVGQLMKLVIIGDDIQCVLINSSDVADRYFLCYALNSKVIFGIGQRENGKLGFSKSLLLEGENIVYYEQ